MIFLGGSCNPTTWRADIAIPLLDAAVVGYYNPQVDDWHPALMDVEAKAKASADVLLFVIDGQTRAIASILEATEYICTGRGVVLVVQDIDTVGAGFPATSSEIKDLNRARAYLRDLALRHDVSISDDVESAVKQCIALMSELSVAELPADAPSDCPECGLSHPWACVECGATFTSQLATSPPP